MIRKCVTAEDMRRLEAEVSYFYSHGGPAMNDGIPCCNECAMTENHTPIQTKVITAAKNTYNHRDTNWRKVVREGDLEAEIAYFYTHGGPAMD